MEGIWMKTMKGVVFPGNKQVLVKEFPVPAPGPNEVLIEMKASAICRSDMSLYYGNPVVGGEATKSGAIIPGHERQDWWSKPEKASNRLKQETG